MLEQVPDVGPAALQTMQVLELPVGRYLQADTSVTHTISSIPQQPVCQPQPNLHISTSARPFESFFKSVPSDLQAQNTGSQLSYL